MSSICPRFVQNAWKKDLCSNCFKSKEEHNLNSGKKLKLPPPSTNAKPPKGIIKSLKNANKKRSVSFPKEVSEVIGYGGEWSDCDDTSDVDDDEVDNHFINEDDIMVDHEPDPELIRLTKSNTDFNMNNENLLVDQSKTDSKKKTTFTSLKLGVSPKKQPLQITVLPFGQASPTTNKVSDMKQMFNTTMNDKPTKTLVTSSITITTNDTEAITPEIEMLPHSEKTLLEEISETLEKNKIKTNNQIINDQANKRSLTRHNAIKKDSVKPKITIFQKQTSNSESDGGNSSDIDNNSGSAYYDVVTNDVNYENVSEDSDVQSTTTTNSSSTIENIPQKKKSSFFSSQLISDMFLPKKQNGDHLRKRSEIYNLTDQSYMSSKITSDGLILTKNNNENEFDSSGSSFDSSSDEEMSSINRSESDSGIGICAISNEYQNVDSENRIKEFDDSKSNDYEVIQIENSSRELAGEPDGRSDPDGSAEAPALPTSPPPSIDARKSFLHSSLQQKAIDKPKVPVKPISVINTFAKRNNQSNNVAQQQVILQLQQVMSKHSLNHESILNPSSNSIPTTSIQEEEIYKTPSNKKCRAPNPPPSPTKEEEKSITIEHEIFREHSTPSPISTSSSIKSDDNDEISEKISESSKPSDNDIKQLNISISTSTLYQRNPTTNTIKSNSPVVREKDKRERATVNPKFRSLNTFNTNRSSYPEKLRPTTPEPAPRKSLSISQDSLNNMDPEKKKKTKFSIKKFLRMGSSSGTTKLTDTNDRLMGKKELSEIPGFDDHGSISPTSNGAKPRLVIIHPLDINNTGVEVIRDIKTTTPEAAPLTISFIPTNDKVINSVSLTGKPPPPPVRTTGIDGNRLNIQDSLKPARPPPPKSAEMRRKQKMMTVSNVTESTIQDIALDKENLNKSDNVYANLGEVRSAIAPRKPERTASMRGEKDTTYDLTNRRRPLGQYENITPILSESKSQENDNYNNNEANDIKITETNNKCVNLNLNISRTSSDASELSLQHKLNNNQLNNNDDDRLSCYSKQSAIYSNCNNSFNERKKKLMEFEKFDSTLKSNSSHSSTSSSTTITLNDNIKTSVQKMTTTIDSYLKDKLSSSGGGASTLHGIKQNNCQFSLRTGDSDLRSNYSNFDTNNTMQSYQQQRSSYPDNISITNSVYGGSVIVGGEKLNYRKSDQIDGFNKKFSQVNTTPRAISISYCGSEAAGSVCGESEIYSPYSFYSSEAGNDVALGDPQDGWNTNCMSPTNHKQRSGKIINRLRMRKGRSVVHKNLEDNYGAVVVANHEALAQVLDQLQQSAIVPMYLRPIANSLNLRFDDFQLVEGARGVVVGHRAFHSAIWSTHIQVTVALTADCNQMYGVGGDLNQLTGGVCGALNPIAEFCDLVPSHYLPLMPSPQMRMIQSTISVLPRMHIDTLQSLGSILKSKTLNSNMNLSYGGSIPNLTMLKEQQKMRNGNSVQNLTTLNDECNIISPTVTGVSSNFDELLFREVGFVMLQLINGLKNLQAKGIEELPLSLSNVILCREVENKESQARLCVLQSLNQDLGRDEEEPIGTLCQCANTALTTMLPYTKFTSILSKILVQEKSDSLSKSKSILEYIIWGPSDVQLTGSIKERELALQRWLDLERATVLHGLVRTRIELTVYDECHLMFLVRSNAKIMCEASSILIANE